MELTHVFRRQMGYLIINFLQVMASLCYTEIAEENFKLLSCNRRVSVPLFDSIVHIVPRRESSLCLLIFLYVVDYDYGM